MIACDTLFDSSGGFSGDKLSSEDIAEIDGLRDVATATNFGTTFLPSCYFAGYLTD